MYKDIPEYKYIENKYEMYFYAIVLSANDTTAVNKLVLDVTQSHFKIAQAMSLVAALQELDYTRFFTLINELNYIESCVAFNVFPFIRSEAVKIIRQSHLQFTVNDL